MVQTTPIWMSFLPSLMLIFGLPLGVPPMPETQLLSKIAPEECLFYMSSSGMATPDPKSQNQTEQLLAEPDVQKAFAGVEKIIKTKLGKAMAENGVPAEISGDEIVDFMKLLLTRPMAVYISEVQMNSDVPAIRGAMAIKIGDDAEKVKAKIEQYINILLPQQPQTMEIGGDKFQSVTVAPNVAIVWGVKKNFILAAVGKGEMESVVKRAGGKAPGWFEKIRRDLPVERVSTIGFLNVKALSKIFMPMAGPQAIVMQEALGLSNVNNIATVAGLEQNGYVSRTLILLDGEPQGLMKFSTIMPLSADDLASIPADATLALAAKINLLAVFDASMAMREKTDPRAAAEIQQSNARAESQFGLKIREEIFQPLGDAMRLYASPGAGGLPEMMIIVQIKDAQQAAKTHEKIIQQVQAMLKAEAERNPNAPKLDITAFSGKDIYSVSIQQPGIPVPVQPSWCLTEKELVISLSPQSVQAYLTRAAGFKSLAQSTEVAKAFNGEGGPMALFYFDVRQTVEKIYPMLPMASAMMQQQGMSLDLSILPPQNAITGHLTPLVTSVRQTKSGIEITERTPVPGLGIAQMAPILAAILPKALVLRGAARPPQTTDTQSMNNMKAIMLAMHVYHEANKRLPAAYNVDKDGKALLSWRVHILPMLEQEELYKQFNLEEAWDSETNKKLIAKMPSEYKSPNSQAGEGKTNYLTVRNKNSAFPGKKGLRFQDIQDGTSNTIALVEVSDGRAVIWTKPDDLKYKEEEPMKGIAGLQPNGFLAAFVDGSVRLITSSIDAETLKGLFTRNGSETVEGKY